jgi:hypothetical protein
MKERHDVATYRIASFGLGVLVVVASLTGQGQVVQLSLSALTLRNDVFDRKRLHGKARLAAAILTAAVGTLYNSLFLSSRYSGLRHTQVS